MKDEKKKKVLEKIKSQKDILTNEYLKDMYSFDIHFVINEKPIAYARARSGRGHFFNPKANEEKRYRALCKAQLTVDEYNQLKPLLENPDSIYYVEMDCNYYIPINETDSITTAALKELSVIPATTHNGDIDNYTKFVLDSLHEVIYTDDMRVTKISATKKFSLDPRSEINIKVVVIKK